MAFKDGSFILRLYFAVVSAVTLFTLMFGGIDLLTIGLKTYVIPSANLPGYLQDCSQVTPVPTAELGQPATDAKTTCEAQNQTATRQFQQQNAANAVRDLAVLIVSLPLFILHFRILLKDWKESHHQ